MNQSSAVNWLWKVIQEHLKNPFDMDEWKIAIEFAQQLENDNLKKAYIDGAINVHNNMVQENISVFDENILSEKLQSFIKNKANLN